MNAHEPDRLEAILTDARAELLARTVGMCLGLPVSSVPMQYLPDAAAELGLRLFPDLSAGVLPGLIEWFFTTNAALLAPEAGTLSVLTGFIVLVALLVAVPLCPLVGWDVAGRVWRRARRHYTTETNDE